MDILQDPNHTLGTNSYQLLAAFLLGITTLLMLWHTYKKQSYWRKIGIPYVKPYPVVGSIYDSFNQPLHEADLKRSQKYGRIYGHYEGTRAVLSIADPEILRNILVKDFQVFTNRRTLDTGDKITAKMASLLEGEDWKRVRTIITPTFTTGKIKRMMSIFKECSQILVQNFKEGIDKGKPIDVKTIYAAFTMDVIASSAFSTKLDFLNDPNNEFARHAEAFFSKGFNWRFLLYFLAPVAMKIFRISIFPQKSIQFFTDVTLQIIEERNKTQQKRNDFLQLLIDTAKELPDERKVELNEKDFIMENYGNEENSNIFRPISYRKKGLSHEEMIAQCMSFFLAGHETTSSALSFVSYLLALHPEIQEKVIEELDEALREKNGELTYEAIQNMKYLDNVISETMRLYPPLMRIERVAEADYKLGDTGLIVPKGMIVGIPVYSMHRDPEFFPDPEKFDPERFNPEERSKRNQYAYLPFGAGPRNCIGMRFVLVQLKVCLTYVLSNFKIKKCSQTKVPLEWYKGQGILQAKDVTLLLEPRSDAVKIS